MIYNTSSTPITLLLAVLASVGAINWGLISAFDFNLVTYLLGEGTTLTRIVYAGVGIGGLFSMLTIIKSLAAFRQVDVK